MKIILVSGGLGNQMFQYAFYCSCISRGIKSVLDVSAYKRVKMHNGYELDRVFGIEAPVSKDCLGISYIRRAIFYFKPHSLVFQGPCYKYSGAVYSTQAHYLIGDWIHPNYFKGIEREIRTLYQFKNIGKENLSLADQMQEEQSVSLHIRRGDYLNLPNYCVCTEDYYTKAIKYVCENVINPIFYVFSNDPGWCYNYISKFNVKFFVVENNQGRDSFQDMFLMTQCKHNIIANSTFSWWGAWLNQYVNKIVVAPKYWFKNSLDNANCDGWYLVEN